MPSVRVTKETSRTHGKSWREGLYAHRIFEEDKAGKPGNWVRRGIQRKALNLQGKLRKGAVCRKIQNGGET